MCIRWKIPAGIVIKGYWAFRTTVLHGRQFQFPHSVTQNSSFPPKMFQTEPSNKNTSKLASCRIFKEFFRLIFCSSWTMKVLKCDLCSFTAPKNSRVRSHKLSVHSKATPWPCTFLGCNYAAKLKGDLKGHSKVARLGARVAKSFTLHIPILRLYNKP